METLISAIKIAFHSIFVNKVRSFLTMLGIIIGVGSVVLLTSIGTGLQNYITEQFNSFGATNVFVLPGDIFGEGGGFSAESQQSAFINNKLRMKDVLSLQNLDRRIITAIPEYTNSAQISFKEKKKKTTIYATSEDYDDVTSTKATKGRFFSKAERLSRARVAFLGPEIANKLFGSIDPIGKRIRIGSQSFEVVGIAEKKGGGFGGPSFDSYVFLPIEVAMDMYDAQAISQITIQARTKDDVNDVIELVKKQMGKRLKSDEFSVFEQTKILETINQVLGMLTTGLGGIAAISLVVGGIGILNIMLVSVIERTREIGLRKAVGATPNVILVQFLIESAMLSVVGGMLGTGLAYVLSLLITRFIPATVTLPAVVLAFSVSAAIGIIFGAIPARRASKLSPIEALRYE